QAHRPHRSRHAHRTRRGIVPVGSNRRKSRSTSVGRGPFQLAADPLNRERERPARSENGVKATLPAFPATRYTTQIERLHGWAKAERPGRKTLVGALS